MNPILKRPEGAIGGTAANSSDKKLKQRARSAVARISKSPSSMGGAETAGLPARCLKGISLKCNVVDFGNACWSSKPIAEEIQTRQYRAPEVILQSGYSFAADMWSFACIAFELATGEMMFTPNAGQDYSEDEDHLALMMEVLGKMPRKLTATGIRSKDYFTRHGDLKRIQRLKYSSVARLLVDKYKFSAPDARELAEFLCPILNFEPEKRPTAGQCLQQPWLKIRNSNLELIDE